MEDLIRRLDAIDVLMECGDWYSDNDEAGRGVNQCIGVIHDLPSAEPEIVWCKDCKHYLPPHGCGHIDGMVTSQKDGFCSYAERKENG